MASIISASTTSATALNLSGDTTGILQLATGTTPTTAVTIDASQNVGIGTSTTGTNGVLTVYKTLEPKIYLTDATVGQNYGGAIKGYGITGVGGAVELGSVDNNVYSKGWFYSLAAGYQAFYTGVGTSTERMRIDSSGNVLVGTTSAFALPRSLAANLYASTGIGVGNATTGLAIQYNQLAFNAAYLYVLNGSGVGVYLTNGATAWTASSDERLKTDLKPIENGLDKVNSLRSVTGRFKTDEENVSRSFLIAQDVQAVLPEAISETPDGYLGVQYTDVIPLLVASIKELKAIIDLQATRISALEAK